MQRRHFVFGTLASVASLAVMDRAGAQAAAKPSDVVKRIYTFSAGKNGAWDNPSAYYDDDMRKATFTKAFRDAIAEEESLLSGELGAVDFDPISNSQDPTVVNLSITDVEVGPAKARVEAKFRRGQESTAQQTQVVYLLVQEGGQWRVDDIVPSGDDGSDFPVRKALADSIRDLKTNATPAPTPAPGKKP